MELKSYVTESVEVLPCQCDYAFSGWQVMALSIHHCESNVRYIQLDDRVSHVIISAYGNQLC